LTHPKWLELAWRDDGIREKKGSLSNPKVMRYYRDVGADWVKGDDVAWCAAFVGSCLERAGLGSTRSLMARSYLKWGRKLNQPRRGAIAVFSRGSNKALGHVGFYIGENARSIFLLGGNQNDSVGIGTYPKSRLLGLRWPKGGREPTGVGDMRNFENALMHVLEFEGGWTNDRQDPGGPTNKGITLEVYAENKGLKLNSRNRSGLMKELRNIPEASVRDIYLRRYWDKTRCPDLPNSIAFIHFDAAVNHGPGRSVVMLQKALGVDVDGEIGPLTIAAAQEGEQALIVQTYSDIREKFYRSLHHFPRFGRGWLRRLRAAKERSLVLVRGKFEEDQKITDFGKETDEMSDKSKWWAQSMTIWGAVVTALSTVLPVIGPLLGYDISADMVAQFGEQVARIIQATGGVVGTLMTVFGRLRTTAPLERRKLSFDF